jgi:hypothetical protein
MLLRETVEGTWIRCIRFGVKNGVTYLLHGAEDFLRSQPVNFAASQEIPRIYGTRKLKMVLRIITTGL